MRENSTSTNRRVELASKDGEITAAPIQRKSSRASRSAAKPIPKEAIESDTAVTKLPSRGKVASKKGQNSATLEAAIDAKTTTTDKKRGKGPANAKAAARAVKEEGDAELESKVTKAVEKKRKTAKDEEVVPPDDKSDKPKKRRKTKEDKEAEAMPLAARTQGLRMHIGAHVSSAKGWSIARSTPMWSAATGHIAETCMERGPECRYERRTHWVRLFSTSLILV